MNNLPKILIVSRLVWDDSSNSNTLGNLFKNYDPEKIARIYIETKRPNTTCCHHFFQISEFSLVKKLFNWRLKTGRVIDTNAKYETAFNEKENDTAKKEASTFSFIRGHRSWIFTLCRDILWALNGWKSKELKKFILDFNPDVIWLDGSPLILMNRLNNYVFRTARKPAVTFLMDDVYSYKSCTSIWSRLYKFFLRKYVKKTVENCNHVFVASPKMKKEYDEVFNVESTFITKSIDSNLSCRVNKTTQDPVKLVYLGNVLIGRLDTLCLISQAISEINSGDVRIELDIYTGDPIDDAHQKLLNVSGVSVYGLVPYSKVPEILNSCDVQVFVEALTGKKKNIARLSFSTKIIDYITSGKCILAVGPNDIAPIEYFKEEDAALVASSKNEIKKCLQNLLETGTIESYARKALECGKLKHNREQMDKLIFSKLREVAFIH